MNSSYPEGVEQSNADPRSPFYPGHICDSCGESEYNGCKCPSEELIAAREIVDTLEDSLSDSGADHAKLMEELEASKNRLHSLKALIVFYTGKLIMFSGIEAAADWECKEHHWIDTRITHAESEISKLKGRFRAAQKAVSELEA